MRASIRQVAQAAGVSAMTVSNVIRGRTDLVAEETRERVLRAVHGLNYVPVRTSAQNRHVQTNAIGVVFLHQHRLDGIVGYPTFLGMCERAKQVDHDLNVFLRSEPDWVKPGTEAQFLDRRCDGFIFIGSNSPELSATLIHHKVPVVECYSVAPAPGVARIIGNNADGMRQAVDHLARLGHTRIAHLAGPHGNLEAEERRDGFRAAMQAICGPGYWDCVIQGDTWGGLRQYHGERERVEPITRPLAEAVLASGATAVVCANDTLALAVRQVAVERGLQVPRDLSITGMDNIQRAGFFGLTSVATPFEEIGRAAVDAFLTLQKGDDRAAASRVLEVSLVKRASTGPPQALYDDYSI